MSETKYLEILKKLEIYHKSDNFSEQGVENLLNEFGQFGGILTKYHTSKQYGETPNCVVRVAIYDPEKEQIANIERFFPTIKYSKDYLRASTPAKPMFYATRYKNIIEDTYSPIKTCLVETIDDYTALVKGEKKVAITLWQVIDDLSLYSIYNWDNALLNNPEMKEIKERHEAFIKNGSDLDKTRSMLEFIATQFSTPNEKDESIYKVTGTIAQSLINKISIKNQIDGIVFPSTKVNGKELNVALIPENAKKKLKCLKVIDCKFRKDGILEVISQNNADDMGNIISDSSTPYKIDLSKYLKLANIKF